MEVLARLRVGIRGETTVTETLAQQQASGAAARGSSQQYVRQTGTLTVAALDLPGLVVAERYLDRQAGSAYALAYLDVAVAEQSLADQIRALGAEWANFRALPVTPGLRPAVTRLQQIKAFQARTRGLEDEASLLVAAQVPVALRSRAQELGLDMARELAGVQPFLTMGARVEGGDLGADVVALLRNVAIRQGFIWTQNSPALTLVIDLRSARQGVNLSRRTWFDVDASVPDLVGTRAMIRVALADASGEAQDSFDLEVKGVGADPFSSERALRKELLKVLPVRFAAFLRELIG